MDQLGEALVKSSVLSLDLKVSSAKVQVRKRQNCEDPFSQYVFREQLNHLEQATTVWI